MKPLVYLAGPITKPDPNVNAHEAIMLADRIMREYPVVLFVPQYSVLHQLVAPKTHQAWLDYDFDVIRRCDAILRIPGDSIGADMEERWADMLDIPVFRLGPGYEIPSEFLGWLVERYTNPTEEAELAGVRSAIQEWGTGRKSAYADYGHSA